MDLSGMCDKTCHFFMAASSAALQCVTADNTTAARHGSLISFLLGLFMLLNSSFECFKKFHRVVTA
jgi:hypothetical protein